MIIQTTSERSLSAVQPFLEAYTCCTGIRPRLPIHDRLDLMTATMASEGKAVIAVQSHPERPRHIEILFYHATGRQADRLMRALFDVALERLQAEAAQIVTTFRPAREAWDLRHRGFEPLDRLRMVRDLTTFQAPEPLVADEYFVVPLREAYIDDLVRPFMTANAGTVEQQLFPISAERARSMLRTFIAEEGSSEEGPSFAVLHSGTPIGALLARRPTPERGELWQIFVAPEHQGRGLGRALLLSALRALRSSGAYEAEVESARHLPAYFLLRWLGFEEAETIPLRFWLRVMGS